VLGFNFFHERLAPSSVVCLFVFSFEMSIGLGIIKVECGSQFSVALSNNGSVYTWGKGDYHRLGHGVDEHVRRPKKVMTLQGKKVISISTGNETKSRQHSNFIFSLVVSSISK
jgi:alpha-tubulin suppressor-like RCC1 family protein